MQEDLVFVNHRRVKGSGQLYVPDYQCLTSNNDTSDNISYNIFQFSIIDRVVKTRSKQLNLTQLLTREYF